jgi:hypothetical protein
MALELLGFGFWKRRVRFGWAASVVFNRCFPGENNKHQYLNYTDTFQTLDSNNACRLALFASALLLGPYS